MIGLIGKKGSYLIVATILYMAIVGLGILSMMLYIAFQVVP